MTRSKQKFKRARPALGTVIQIHLEAEPELAGEVNALMSDAFAKVHTLEEVFSKFSQASDLSRINQAPVNTEVPIRRELFELLQLARRIERVSEGAFTPLQSPPTTMEAIQLRDNGQKFWAQKNSPLALDLSGIAKGFIVDQICEFLTQAIPDLHGVVNAGGDLRFFNTRERTVDLRLNSHPPRFRQIQLKQNSVATSTFEEAQRNPHSSSTYRKIPRDGKIAAVSVIANSCAISDALTKVGWFGLPRDSAYCAREFCAQILIFDQNGDLMEEYPQP